MSSGCQCRKVKQKSAGWRIAKKVSSFQRMRKASRKLKSRRAIRNSPYTYLHSCCSVKARTDRAKPRLLP
jgi:hypothetical protein